MKRSLPWIIGGLLLAGSAQAQTDQAQLVAPPGTVDLNSNLARLAANPRDVSALIGAGEAALALDDPRAAAGFFARADAISSGNGRIKAGLARVNLKLHNPAEALRLFDQAARLGYPDTTILSDRGLARDMSGDQAGAQRDYQAAMLKTPDDAELIRRYAASLGISGQVEASDKVLAPLLYKSDRAAWRYRAFILAMNNKQGDAQKVATQTMPAQLAAAIIPYMQKMPYLTPAQKAAAVHFGQFPQQTGAAIAAVIPTPPAVLSGKTVIAAREAPTMVAAAPATQPQDRRGRRAAQQRSRQEATTLARADARHQPAVAQFQPAPARPAPVTAAPATPHVQAAPTPTPAPAPTPAPVPTPTPAPVRQAIATSPQIQGPPTPGFASVDTPPPAAPSSQTGSPPRAAVPTQAPPAAVAPALSAPAPQAASTPLAVQPAPTPAEPSRPQPQPDPAATRTLADIIRAIDIPDAERQSSVAAVDLNEIATLQAARRAERQAVADKAKKVAIAKAKAEADAKAKKEAEEKKKLTDNPARNWLQIGTGASKSGLSFTLKALRKKYDSLAPQDGWAAPWGRTNRLLVGPFASFTRAKALEDKLKAAGADVFAWKSDAGEVVERLDGR